MSIRLSLFFTMQPVFLGVYAQSIYPDADLPGDTLKLFAKNKVSTGLNNRDFTLPPDRNELFFTLQQSRFLSSAILRMGKKNGQWGKPQVAAFQARAVTWNLLFLLMERHFSLRRTARLTGRVIKDFDIWKVTRLKDG